MLKRTFIHDLLNCICKKDKISLKNLYTKNGSEFVDGAYLLFKNGLITTYHGNFVYGGDDEAPIDIVCPDKLSPTLKGMIFWEKNVKY
jgi:hypothetical protein